MNGNWRGARARDSVLMVTTAAETRLTISAYEVRRAALVVGGGNSAAEAALFLSEEGARTTMAIWREDWENRDPKAGAMKHWVRSPLEREIAEGRLRVVLYKQIDEITPHSVRLTTDTGFPLRNLTGLVEDQKRNFWIGSTLGLFAVRTGTAREVGYADFDWFRVE